MHILWRLHNQINQIEYNVLNFVSIFSTTICKTSINTTSETGNKGNRTYESFSKKERRALKATIKEMINNKTANKTKKKCK